MFGKKKRRENEDQKKERLLKKAMGKGRGRRVFGFQCIPAIPASLKTQAEAMHVPLFALAEHALELGNITLKDAMNDPDEEEELRRHLIEFHVATRTFEKIARYDEDAANHLRMERLRRFNIDKAVRQLAIRFISHGLSADELQELILLGMRCKSAAAAQGWPMPPDIAPRRDNRQSPNIAKNQNLNDKVKEKEDGAPENHE